MYSDFSILISWTTWKDLSSSSSTVVSEIGFTSGCSNSRSCLASLNVYSLPAFEPMQSLIKSICFCSSFRCLYLQTSTLNFWIILISLFKDSKLFAVDALRLQISKKVNWDSNYTQVSNRLVPTPASSAVVRLELDGDLGCWNKDRDAISVEISLRTPPRCLCLLSDPPEEPK